MEHEIVELQEKWLAGLAVDCPGFDTSGIPGLWERFIPRCGEIPAIGGVWGASLPAADGFRYLAGMEVSKDAALPAGFEAVAVPGGKYLKIPFHGTPDKISQEFSRIFSEVLPALGYRIQPGFCCLEEYLEEEHDPQTGAMSASLYVELK